MNSLPIQPKAFLERLVQPGIFLGLFAIPLSISISYVIIGLLLLIWAALRWPVLLSTARHSQHSQHSLYAGFYLFLACALLQAPFGIEVSKSLLALLKLAFLFSFALLLCVELRKEHIPKALLTLLCGQSLAALHTCLTVFLPQLPEIFVGPLSEAGQLALSCVLALGLLLYAVHDVRFRSKLPLRCIFLCILLCILLCALAINMKRGPWLGVLLCSSLLLLHYRPKLALIFLLGCFLILLGIDPLRERLLASQEHFFVPGGRSTIWAIGMELVQRFPLGIGYENSSILGKFSTDIPPELKHFHNNLLNIWVECGFLGLCFFLYWVYRIVVSIWSSRSTLIPQERLLLITLGLALLSSQLAGIIEYNFGDTEVFFVNLVVLGILGALLRKKGVGDMRLNRTFF